MDRDMFPEKFIENMQNILGREIDDFLASYDSRPVQALRVNTLKADTDEFLRNAPFHLEPVEWSPDGFYYESADQPGKHPYHEAGVYYIQEPSAQLPVTLLGVRPGEHILDLCAAPGGKSTQIAAAMQGKGIFVSNEIHPARAGILSENTERMGIVNCVVTNETPERLLSVFGRFFDRILVDAPCSGEGMFRRNAEAVSEWSPENVNMCAHRQDEIMNDAACMLRPGGRLVYSTCTFEEEEDEGSVRRFLDSHPDFSLDKEVRLWPHRIKGEGHFAAVLKYNAVSGENDGNIEDIQSGNDHIQRRSDKRHGKDGRDSSCREESIDEFAQFRESFIKRDFTDGDFVEFGDQLYLCPKGMPSFRGLKVLRPGLHLGTVRKGRFEPSHALALALRPQDVRYSLDLKSDAQTIRDYLNGLTFPAQGENGWYLISVDGYSIGWGKLAGGVMKNHYPIGLRGKISRAGDNIHADTDHI